MKITVEVHQGDSAATMSVLVEGSGSEIDGKVRHIHTRFDGFKDMPGIAAEARGNFFALLTDILSGGAWCPACCTPTSLPDDMLSHSTCPTCGNVFFCGFRRDKE